MMSRTYTPVWSKYRPVILKMMIDASSAPQTYQLSGHEFKALNPGKKGPYAFALHVTDGKATQGLKDSVIAQDLWEVLQQSRKAAELVSGNAFVLSMDKQFALHVQKVENQQQ